SWAWLQAHRRAGVSRPCWRTITSQVRAASAWLMRLPNRNDARNQANSEASSPACTSKPRSRGSSSRRTSVLGHRDSLGLADRLAVLVEERGAAVLAQAAAKDPDADFQQHP